VHKGKRGKRAAARLESVAAMVLEGEKMPSRLAFAFVRTPAAGILPGRHVPAARVRTMDEVTDPQMATRIHRHAYVPGIEGDFRRAEQIECEHHRLGDGAAPVQRTTERCGDRSIPLIGADRCTLGSPRRISVHLLR